MAPKCSPCPSRKNHSNAVLSYAVLFITFLAQFFVLDVYLVAVTSKESMPIDLSCDASACYIYNCSTFKDAVDSKGLQASSSSAAVTPFMSSTHFTAWHGFAIFINVTLALYGAVALYVKCSSRQILQRLVSKYIYHVCGRVCTVIPWEAILWLLYSLTISIQVGVLTSSRSLECLFFANPQLTNLMKACLAMAGVLYVAFVHLGVRKPQQPSKQFRSLEIQVAWFCGLNIIDGVALLDNLLVFEKAETDGESGIIAGLPVPMSIAITLLLCISFCIPSASLILLQYAVYSLAKHSKIAGSTKETTLANVKALATELEIVEKRGIHVAETGIFANDLNHVVSSSKKQSTGNSPSKADRIVAGSKHGSPTLEVIGLINAIIFIVLNVAFIIVRLVLIVKYRSIVSVFLLKNCVAIMKALSDVCNVHCGGPASASTDDETPSETT